MKKKILMAFLSIGIVEATGNEKKPGAS